MRTYRIVSSLCAVGLALVTPAAAETTLCTIVPAVPYTISAPGHYCLDRNLATPASMTTGNAVSINASGVTLDLNGFAIDGTAADPGTRSGIYASDRQNVTIRNGTIRGFYRGIQLRDLGLSAGHLVEHLRLERNASRGIEAMGSDLVVRDNVVVDTVAPTGDVNTFGIRTVGARGRILRNDVMGTLGGGTGIGKGLQVATGQGSIIEGNRVSNSSIDTPSVGIELASGADMLVVGNSITTMQSGIAFNGGSGKYRDNLTSGVPTPYTGGVDAGNNQ